MDPHRVLGPHRDLGPHRVLGPPKVLGPFRVLGPPRVLGLHRVLGFPSVLGPLRVLGPVFLVCMSLHVKLKRVPLLFLGNKLVVRKIFSSIYRKLNISSTLSNF